MNQLLQFNIFSPEIDWSLLTANDFQTALDTLLPFVHEEFELRLNGQLNYYDLFSPEKTPNTTRLGICADFLAMFNTVSQTEEIVKVQNEYLRKFGTLINQNMMDERMHHRIIAFRQSSSYEELSEEKKDFVNVITLRNSDLGMVQNENNEKDKLIEITLEINKQKQIYDNNLQQTQANIFSTISSQQLNGLPSSIVKKIEELPFSLGINKEKVYTVPYSSGLFWDIITYSEESFIRNNFYAQQLTMGRDYQFNNTPIAQTIVDLTHQKSKLLGFDNPSQLLMGGNMFKDSNDVLEIFEQLTSTTANQYELENNIYQHFAMDYLHRPPTLADREYILNKLESAQFSVEHGLIEEYLQEKSIIDGIQNIFGELFDICFEVTQGQKVWNDDAYHLKIFDKHLGNKLGEIFLDLYSRPFKRSGGFCNDLIPRQILSDGSTSTPIVYIICNFSKSANNQNTWSFEKLKTFFHEMGHAFNHIFSKTTVASFSGTNNVQNDAVELASILFEKLCYDPVVLKNITRHIVTGETIPDNYIESIRNSQKFMKATFVHRHALISALDFEIFSHQNEPIEEMEKRLIKKYINYTDDTYGMAQIPSLHHVFTTGYSSGMYVYMWANILASDVFNDFKLAGDNYLEQKSIMKKFRDTILSVGGSKDMLKQYSLFKGKEASIEPFLNEYGLLPPEHSKKYKIK